MTVPKGTTQEDTTKQENRTEDAQVPLTMGPDILSFITSEAKKKQACKKINTRESVRLNRQESVYTEVTHDDHHQLITVRFNEIFSL